MSDDKINSPNHYIKGDIECIDYIDTKGFDFCAGNAIKYITRAELKSNPIEDYQKAVWYLNHKIKLLESEKSQNENQLSVSKIAVQTASRQND